MLMRGSRGGWEGRGTDPTPHGKLQVAMAIGFLTRTPSREVRTPPPPPHNTLTNFSGSVYVGKMVVNQK